MYIIFAIIAFSILILVHELGHFIVAKLNGVYVEEFALGFGPKLFGVKGKETEYNVRVLPFGGYVRMLGEEEDVKDPRAFNTKSPIRKILILAAGVFMNYVLAVVIFTGLAMNYGYATKFIKDVQPNSASEEVGLKTGDEFVKINGKKVHTAEDIALSIALSKGNELKMDLRRDGEIISQNITPKLQEDGSYIIGMIYETKEKPSLTESLSYSVDKIKSLVSQTFMSLSMIFKGEANLKKDVGGPVTIIKMTGHFAKAGIEQLLWFTAFLSVQLAVFNLLPFPALDGGSIFILLIEMITRKKIPNKYVEKINYAGFMLLMVLMVVVTIKDIIFPVKF